MPVSVTKDGLPDLLKAIRALTKSQVLVGVPDENAERRPVEGEANPANNALIGYVQEFGDPAKNIPARPFLIPGVESVKDQIAAQMKKAGQDALSGNLKAIRQRMAKVGNDTAAAVVDKLETGPYAPLSLATIKARARRGRKNAKQYLKLMNEGVPVDVLDEVGLAQPLHDTGQLARSITYVIRQKGK